MDGHRTAERRSIAYHREIVRRLAESASVLDVARARVHSWREPDVHPSWRAAWAELLSRPLEELSRALVDDGEHMTSLRQMSPFAGVLDPRTRWAIWKSVT